MADKFKVGDPVVCVSPSPNGPPGFLNRRGVVVSAREWWTTYENGFCFCYGVNFDGEPRAMAALEWELGVSNAT